MTRTKFLLSLAALAAAIFAVLLLASALLMTAPSGDAATPTAIAAQASATARPSLAATLVPTVTPLPASATPSATPTDPPTFTPAPPSATPSPSATRAPESSATPLPMLVLPAATLPGDAPTPTPTATLTLVPVDWLETAMVSATPADTALALLASPATRSWIVTATPGPPPTREPLPTPGAVLPSPVGGLAPEQTPATPTPPTPAAPSATPIPPTPMPTIAIIVPPGCEPPEGWAPYRVEEGDTLFGFQLGSGGSVDVATIRAENCLRDNFLSIGQIIFLPPGAAENAPKVDVSGGGPAAPALPAGTTRNANCPCTVNIGVGWRLEQIAAAIDAAPVGFTGADFLAATRAGAPLPDHWFLASKPAGVSLEGYMLPGSYTLDNATDAVGFRDMVLNAFAANVGRDLEAGAAANGLTFWQVVNLASIVQRESRDPGDQPLVASVFHNRLRTGRGLGATVTIQYVLGRPGDWWPRLRAGDANLDSPYNGNRYKGLPPTPISNPGLDALRAAAFPAQTDYLYFSARCDGLGHFYASTFEQFQAGLNCGN